MGSLGDQWVEVAPQALQLGVEVASGSSASVYRAKGSLLGEATPQDVCVRKPRIRSSEALERFEHEVRIRASLRHPNLLQLSGACTKPPFYCTISPWMEGGCAFDVVHGQGVRFTWKRVLELGVQFARGMQYLHSRNILHRDLKTANLLLGEGWRTLVVSDLDLAVDQKQLLTSASENGGRALGRGPSNGRLRHMVGTLVYMAPEVLRGAPHSYAADVYAFAITLNEIAAASVPYIDRKLPVPELHTVLETRFNEVTLRAAITRDALRPVMAVGTPPEFHQLINAAWHPDPLQRPNFDQILLVLESLLAKGDGYNSQFQAAAGLDVSAPQTDGTNGPILANEMLLAAQTQIQPVWLTNSMVPQTYSYLPVVTAGVSATSGKRGEDRMEDRHVMVENLGGVPHHHLFAVLDGHGGQACSQLAAELLPGSIIRRWGDADTSPDATLIHAYEDLDNAYASATNSQDASGSTALTALICGDTLYVANAGDCRCVLSSTTGVYTLNNAHVSTNAKEKAMVEARGGSIIDDRVDGIVAITRSLGDLALKPALTASPEVITRKLTSDDEFLVIASDGLWDVVETDEVVRLVKTTVRVAEMASKRVALKALELGSSDNVTCIVVYLRAVESLSMLD